MDCITKHAQDNANFERTTTRVPDWLEVARLDLEAGLSVVPKRGKRPALPKWEEFQKRRPTDGELCRWFTSSTEGLGIICGAVSGNVETIDFDIRGEFFDEWKEVVDSITPGLTDRLYIESSPSGGKHVIYSLTAAASEPDTNGLCTFTPSLPGNTELAHKRITESDGPIIEKAGKPYVVYAGKESKLISEGGTLVAYQVAIETRGEGGFIVTAPTPGYITLQGKLEQLPTITSYERDALIMAAKSLNEQRTELAPKALPSPTSRQSSANGTRPGDAFNGRATARSVGELLERHDWTRLFTHADNEHWRRPGKRDGGTSATLRLSDLAFYCFSSNASPLESGSSYSPFALLTTLDYGGDYAKAARELSHQGYGDDRQRTSHYQQLGDPTTEASANGRRDVFGYPISTAEGRTDLSNSRRFATQHGRNTRWIDAWEEWLIWDEKRWKVDGECRIFDLAKATANDVWQEVRRERERLTDELEDEDLEKLELAMKGFARTTSSATGIRSFLTLAKGETGIAITHDQLDRDPWLLNVANGTLDLLTGELQPHKREHYATKLAAVTHDHDAECPTWRRFITEVTVGDAELAGFLQRLVGYSLTGSTRDHVLPFLYGAGANGKSVFCATVAALLGNDYAMQAAPELLMARSSEQHPTERADLFGKRLVITNEIESGRRLNESLVKDLTGGDRIRARRMREDFWEFAPTHKVWMIGNHKPAVRGTDNGIWRRIKLVPFSRVFGADEQDKKLPQKLLAELPGILNWAIAGCLLWQRDGLGEPEAVANATREYRCEQDIVGAFVEERCLTGFSCSVKANAVYQDYRAWAEAAGDRPMNIRTFGSEFGRRFEKFTCNGVVYRGVQLKASSDDAGRFTEGTEGTE